MIDLALDRARAWLAPAIRERPLYRLDDVEQMIRAGRMRLHVGEAAAVVTEFEDNYPTGERVVNVWLGGGDLTELMDMHERIEREAMTHGATQMLVHGRAGWGRQLRERGYAPWATITRKLLNG